MRWCRVECNPSLYRTHWAVACLAKPDWLERTRCGHVGIAECGGSVRNEQPARPELASKASKIVFVAASSFAKAVHDTASRLGKRIVLIDGEQLAAPNASV